MMQRSSPKIRSCTTFTTFSIYPLFQVFFWSQYTKAKQDNTLIKIQDKFTNLSWS